MRRPRVALTGIVAVVLSAGCSDATAPATVVDLSGPWARSTPEQAGFDPAALAQAVSAAAAASRCRSLLVARHGRLVLEQYFGGADSATRFDVRSVTKSVVSALVGIAIAQGRLPGISATVGGYLGPPDTLDAGDRTVTVAQLLTMTSGYAWNETSWESLESGTVNGGSGIALTGRDLLRYGQLVLQHGRSGSHQIVPPDWVGAMTAPQFGWRETDGPQHGVSYGYLWWTADGPPAHAAFAWGYGGQFIYVVPSLDLVAVATTAWQGLTQGSQSQAVTDSTWSVIVDGVLPAAH